jgi:Uri superfamily endonuclease
MTVPGPLTKSNDRHIPAAPGTYIVHLSLSEAIEIQIGRKGTYNFQPGHYVYCGNALGPGGLARRLNRHVNGIGSLHWHIDYLRQVAVVLGWGFREGRQGLECEWSQEIARLPGAMISVTGFGASDCRSGCKAHLIFFRSGEEPKFENGVKLRNVYVWRTC